MSDEQKPKVSLKDLDIQDRITNGIEHHPDAEALARAINQVDFHHYSDSMELNFGGDGDNGEILSMILSDLVENGIVHIEFKKTF